MIENVNTSIITVKGQIVIPAALRLKHHLKKGMRVFLLDRGEEIVVRPLTKDYFEKMAGVLKTSGTLSKKLLRERAKDKEREESR